MKTFMFKYIFASLLLIGLLSSCHKDDEGFTPASDPDEVNYTSDIYGVVTSEGYNSIQDAIVTYKGITAITDENGVYVFEDVEVGDQHNVIKIEKDGYFESARTFRSRGSSTQYQRTILQRKLFTLSFPSSEESTITKDQVSMTFPAQSVVVESSGELYSGEVQIAIKTIDPSLDNLAEVMPGDMTARDEDNSLLTLQSFGMVNVELRSPSGEKLQIADDKTVEMSYVVSDQFLSDAQESIDMWSFDYNLGVWIKEGTATLQGNTYSGNVSHFSCWNYDASARSVVVTGRVVSGQTEFPYFRISILNADNKGGRGTIDSESVFSGRVEQGVELTLTISTFVQNCVDPIFEIPVGPFFEDTDLGDIQVVINAIDFLTITGTAVDCNSNIVEKGEVSVFGMRYPFEDGAIDLNLPFCTNTNVDLIITDRVNLFQTVVSQLPAPGDHNLNQLMVCGQGIDNVKLDNLFDWGSIDLLDDLNMYIQTTSVDDQLGVVEGFLNDPILSVATRLRFYMSNAFDPKDFEEKTYPLTEATFDWGDDVGDSGNWGMASGQMGELTIDTIENVTTDIKRATGVFSVECTEATTGAIKTLTGSFAISYF